MGKIIALLCFYLALPVRAESPDPLLLLAQQKFPGAAVDAKLLKPENRDFWESVLSQIWFPLALSRLDHQAIPRPVLRAELSEILAGRVARPPAVYVAYLSANAAAEPAVSAYQNQAKVLAGGLLEPLLAEACAVSAGPGEIRRGEAEAAGDQLRVIKIGSACLPLYLSHRVFSVDGTLLESKAFDFMTGRESRLVLKGEAKAAVGSDPAACGFTAQTQTGEVTVALLDSGLDYNHPGFSDALLPGLDPSVALALTRNLPTETPRQNESRARFLAQPARLEGGGWDFLENNDRPMDFFESQSNPLGWMATGEGHGSHVAGIARGGNEQIKILPLRMIGQNKVRLPDGTFAEKDAYAISYDAIQLAGMRGARVANISLDGAAERGAGLTDGITDHPEILFTLSAGNNGLAIDRFAIPLQSFLAPNVLRVASFDPATDQLAADSNYGPAFVDLAAPGLGITSCVVGGGRGEKSGTSMAAPAVANAAATLFGLDPTLNPAAVARLLCAAADPWEPAKVRCGKLNGARAVAMWRAGIRP